MAFDRGQVLSYTVSGATSGISYVAKEVNEQAKAGADIAEWATRFVVDAANWSAMEQVTVSCMTLGAFGVAVRLYIDISGAVQRNREHKARMRAYKSGVS